VKGKGNTNSRQACNGEVGKTCRMEKKPMEEKNKNGWKEMAHLYRTGARGEYTR